MPPTAKSIIAGWWRKRMARLQKMDLARGDLKEFRRLADEARFFAATTDPVSEHAPYFDPREGEEKARAALAFADKWGGPSLSALPLSRRAGVGEK